MPDYLDRVPATASVQYGDLKGTAAADQSDSGNGGLLGLAALIGGKDSGWPIAMSWYIGARGVNPFVHVSLYCIPSEAGVVGVDAAKKYINERSGDIEVVRHTTTSMPPIEFLMLFKRFDIFMAARGLDIENLNVIREHSVDDD
jgi:hypothetical protein